MSKSVNQNNGSDISRNRFSVFEKKYAPALQAQMNNHNQIVKSVSTQGTYLNEYATLDDASIGALNPNVPSYNSQYEIKVGDKNAIAHKKFWNFKHHAGGIFTDYEAAGSKTLHENMSVRNLPLKSMGLTESTPNLVMSNMNLVRNNMQNHGKLFLDTANALNAQSFAYGAHDMSTNSYRGYKGNGPYYEHTPNEDHNGDTMSYNPNQLRVDLPSNYANISVGSWQTINPSYINKQTGKVDLELLKNTGRSCLTKDFGFETDVFNDDNNLSPMPEGLYCSKNTNFVSMPVNYEFSKLDTSFSVAPVGTNSTTLGATMSSSLKDYIETILYDYNKKQVAKQNDPNYMKLTDLQKYDEVMTYKQKQTEISDLGALIKGTKKQIFRDEMYTFINMLKVIKYENTYLLLPNMMGQDLFDLKKDAVGTCTPGNAEECCFQGVAGQWQGKDVDYLGVVPDPNLVVNDSCSVNPFGAVGW